MPYPVFGVRHIFMQIILLKIDQKPSSFVYIVKGGRKMQDLPAGNTNSIESTVYTYGDMLYRICYVMLKNEHDAKDALQETVIKYIEKRPKLNDGEHTKAWLIKVAKNKCRDILRYRQRHQYTDIENIGDIPEQASDSGIIDALMSLPEKYRIVLVLHYVEEYKVSEIAKIVGKTPSAVKMRLSKGRKLLKEKYTKEDMADDR